MRKGIARAGALLLAALIVFATFYEFSTHVGRGWLRGEAFYDGRPTAFWRARVDHWLTQFVDPEDAVRCLIIINGADAVDGVPLLRPARHPVWGPVRELFQSAQAREREWDTPKVLMGDPGAAAVLQELAREEKYRAVAKRALQ
jgi:hypothetical protein